MDDALGYIMIHNPICPGFCLFISSAHLKALLSFKQHFQPHPRLHLVTQSPFSTLTMKLTSIITAIVCAEAVIGARFTEKRRESRAARQLARRSSTGATRSSQPLISSESLIEGVTNQSNVEYSSNWAGAVLISTGFTEVTGTVTVPTLTGSSSSSVESAGSAVGH